MRKIFEELGAEVEWNDSTQTAKGEKSGTVCTFSIGDNMLYKNDEAIELIAPAILENNRTLCLLYTSYIRYGHVGAAYQVRRIVEPEVIYIL